MTSVGQREKLTQLRVIDWFRDALGYRYLGNWADRPANANVEPDILRTWLKRRPYDDRLITKALWELDQARALGGSKTLYEANMEVYRLLRYGVKVSPEAGEQKQTVWLIDWKNPHNNDFAIAEEVTVFGANTKRPDLVLFVNGIALGVLELKRSTVSVSEGIRQSLDSQKKEFIQPFYTTVQLVMAGNDTEGLRYAPIDTPEKYWLTWKEPSELPNPLDRALQQLCRKERLLEIVHDFIAFDAGIKKTCRHNQFFGVKAAQAHAARHDGGVIWHTQGSGKTLTMVWLARWLREHVPDGRVLIITDRKELDQQIEEDFFGVGETIYRTKDGGDLLRVLNGNTERLVCSLIHKFGGTDEGNVETFLAEIRTKRQENFTAKGELFVFVDECHRTQSNDLHRAMKALLPDATFIGFTGTPLLKKDAKKSIEVFGPYIHTYKYDEAVRDEVVLDLRYEARDIDQEITSQTKVDQFFEAKTKGLTPVARAQLKQRWGTMQKVLSSRSRLAVIVADILLDMEVKDRLSSGRGNAILVADSIYSACRYFEMFQETPLKGKCAIVTSYVPVIADTKGEDAGEGETEKLDQYGIYRRMLADHFNEPEDVAATKVEQFEREVKHRFVHHPGQMKLLIVVDKLLTGFDAPSATYLYIDKQMRDHGLFQAICRVNRLDGEDKEYGYVVDYKDLFKSLEKSIQDYTGEAFDGYDKEDVAGLLENRLEKGRERLEEALEQVRALCEPVALPRDTLAYIRFFCGDSELDPDALKNNEQKRVALYKLVASLVRAFANLANEMEAAGFSAAETEIIKRDVAHYEKVREEIKLASGDYVDMKMFEPAMRHLLDHYVRADDSVVVSTFDDMTLIDLIVKQGPAAVDNLSAGIKQSQGAVAETIENNVRTVIIDQMAANPKYYEKMSQLLEALILERKQQAIAYSVYLAKIAALSKQIVAPESGNSYPTTMTSRARRALYDNLGQDESLALRIDEAVQTTKKADWKGNLFKEREVKKAIREQMAGYDAALVDEIFTLVKNQIDY